MGHRGGGRDRRGIRGRSGGGRGGNRSRGGSGGRGRGGNRVQGKRVGVEYWAGGGEVEGGTTESGWSAPAAPFPVAVQSSFDQGTVIVLKVLWHIKK